MNTKNLKSKRVIIFQQRSWGRIIGVHLAKRFHEEGCALATVTSHLATHDYILKKAKEDGYQYELVVNHDALLNDSKKFLDGDDYSVEEMCKYLGIDSIWPLVANNRLFCRSYKDKYYYGFKKNLPDEAVVEYFKAVFKLAKMFFDEFKPDVIVAPNFVGLYHMVFNLFAEKHGIKMIAMTNCKVKGLAIFSYNWRGDKGSFLDRVDELNSGRAKSANSEKARTYIKEFRDKFKKPDFMFNPPKKTFIRTVRHFFAPYYHILRWYIKRPVNPWKNIGVNIDWRPPRIILRDHYAHDRYTRFANKYKYYPFDQVKRFAYFPMQVQPEETMDVIAPFCSNQIEVARLIAMSLPKDLTLVVKDHPLMLGKRPPSYLEKVARTANVKLIDYRIPSEEILKKMDIMISPSGTSLAEATFYNKPAIQFGDLGITQKLPNVFKHSDFTTLTKKINEVLALNLHTPEYEKRLENYVAAAYDMGFDLDYVAMWVRGEKLDKLDSLWQAYKTEVMRVIK